MRAAEARSSEEKRAAPAACRRARLGVATVAAVLSSLAVTTPGIGAAERPKSGGMAGGLQRSAVEPDCLPAAKGQARVAVVTGATTMSLDDGRLVRLATVSAPSPLGGAPFGAVLSVGEARAPDSEPEFASDDSIQFGQARSGPAPSAAIPARDGADAPDGPAGGRLEPPSTGTGGGGVQSRSEAAGSRLAALVEGRNVTVHPVSGTSDRHGRLRAHLVTDDGQSVATVLVGAGLLRVEPSRDDTACARVLLRSEEEARAAGRGFWRDADAVVLAADDPALAEKAGRYAVVEGRVLSTGHAGTRTYLNFGRRFASDFTAVIDDKEMPRFQSAGFTPARLEGRTIRVRGWLTARDGGFMSLSVPEEIEWVR